MPKLFPFFVRLFTFAFSFVVEPHRLLFVKQEKTFKSVVLYFRPKLSQRRYVRFRNEIFIRACYFLFASVLSERVMKICDGTSQKTEVKLPVTSLLPPSSFPLRCWNVCKIKLKSPHKNRFNLIFSHIRNRIQFSMISQKFSFWYLYIWSMLLETWYREPDLQKRLRYRLYELKIEIWANLLSLILFNQNINNQLGN